MNKPTEATQVSFIYRSDKPSVYSNLKLGTGKENYFQTH